MWERSKYFKLVVEHIFTIPAFLTCLYRKKKTNMKSSRCLKKSLTIVKFKFVACPDSKSSILYIYIFYEFWRDWCIWIFYRINRLICFKRKTGNQLQNSCGSDKTTVRLIYGIGYSFGAKVSKKLQVTPNKKMIHSTYRLLSVPSFGKEGERFANQAFVKE